MFSRFIALVVFFSCCAQPIYAASTSKEGALQFEITIAQGAEKYLELLAYPAYLAVALENIGIKTSNMGRPTLIDEHTIKLKSAMLRFAEKKGAVYSYEGSLEWDIPFKHLKFEVPVEIDISSITKGSVQVGVFLPIASFFPDVLVERIRMKIQMLSGPSVQKQLLGYLDGLSSKTDTAIGLQGLFPKIMLQSFSAPIDAGGVCISREPGDAESLSDQAYLLATLAIWLVIVPALITAFIIWRSYKNRKQNE